MENLCCSSYTFVGDENEIKELYDLMKGLELKKEETPLTESDYGQYRLGNLVVALGGKWSEIWCSGTWTDLTIEKGILKFMTKTARSPANELMDFICKKFHSMKYFFCFYTEGNCAFLYETNDTEGRFYPDRYVVNICTAEGEYYTEYFQTDKSAFEWVEKLTGHRPTSIKDADRIDSAMSDEYEDAYLYINEIEVIDS